MPPSVPPSTSRVSRSRRFAVHAACLTLLPALVVAAGPGSTASAAPASAVPTTTVATSAPAAAAAAPRIRFKTASFNILGSHHTAGPGGFADGKKRARLAVKFLKNEGTSVLGMSEAEREQMRIVTRRGGFTSFPSWRKSTDTQTAQSVVWKPKVWAKVRSGRFVIPFNYGNSREQPMVLLRHKASGKKVWVVSVHLQSGSSKAAVREREVGMQRTIRQVKRLTATGNPVLLSGDMNDRKRIFCQVRAKTALLSASGGSWRRGACRPPGGARIDWIFGGKRLSFSNFRYANSRRINAITDHTVPVATVTW